MKRTLLFAVLLPVFLPGCPKPVPAVPTKATGTQGLVVCWNDAENRSAGDDKAFLAAFRKRLELAGYDLTSSPCDISFAYAFKSKTEHGEDGYTHVSVTLSDAHTVIDEITLDFNEVYELPTSDHDRLAILVVNGMNASEKLARYTRQEHPGHPLHHGPSDDEDAGFAKTKNLIQ